MNRITKFSLFLLISCVFINGCTKSEIGSTPSIVSQTANSGSNKTQTTVVDEHTPQQNGSEGSPEVDDEFLKFLDDSYTELMLRDPEYITELGLGDIFELGDGKLTDISDEYIRETQRMELAVLQTLKSFDRNSLSPSSQISFDVYLWHLEDRASKHAFMYYGYPVSHGIFGTQNQLIYLFTDLHPLKTTQNVEDYLSRLTQIEWKISQLIEGLERRKDAGIIAPKRILEMAIYDINDIWNTSPEYTPLYSVFANKLSEIDELSASEKDDYLNTSLSIIQNSVQPAYNDLNNYVEDLYQIAPESLSLTQFINGDKYYSYLLRHHTTLEISPKEVHDIGKNEVQRITNEMIEIFVSLGYPKGRSLEWYFSQLRNDSPFVRGEDIVSEYERILDEMDGRLLEVFSRKPKADVIIIGGDIGGFYISPTVDGSRPGAFYANATGIEHQFTMPTLTYHETVPGHHMQIALSQELQLPIIRKDVGFTGYVEGWALYAERLAYEMGVYDNDPYGDLGRLQAEAFRAARLVVDTGIHFYNWDLNKSVDFMVESTGFERDYMYYEVIRYATIPGQATAYKIGMMSILDLRERYKKVMGDAYDIKGFHDIILLNGSVPLDMLETLVLGG